MHSCSMLSMLFSVTLRCRRIRSYFALIIEHVCGYYRTVRIYAGFWLERSVEVIEWSSVMELVIIVSTITSFFSHYMIEKGVVANAVSVLLATLITWMLIGDPAADFDTIFMRNIVITAVLALVVSVIVGLVFAHHKKCT